MKLTDKNWLIKQSDPKKQCILGDALQISSLTAQLLINRGLENQEEAEAFLVSSITNLSDPKKIYGMEEAVARFLQAYQKKEKILVYGDYDVDGIAATAILQTFIQRLGLPVDYLIPHRLDNGYGLSMDILPTITASGASLVITVDCGISAIEEIHRLQAEGIDVIITDHHLPGTELPAAAAIVNPKLGAPKSALDLAGVGVAYKFIQVLAEELGQVECLPSMLDLVALGTVADMVTLFGDNRIFVKEGLAALQTLKRPGVKSLFDISGIDVKNMTPRDLSFGPIPRLNAAGRLGDCKIALALLLTESDQQADELAELLNRANQERQQIEGAILKEAEEMITQQAMVDDHILILASENWHPGILGIVASKLSNKYYKPTTLIAVEGEEGRGSFRSIPGCNIYEALTSCAEELITFGGHPQAAGISIKKERIDSFRDKMNQWAIDHIDDDVFIPRLNADAEVILTELNHALLQEIEQLEPYGEGNPQPVLVARGLPVRQAKNVGKQSNHLKMTFGSQAFSIDAIGFKMGAELEVATTSDLVDAAFHLERNQWNGMDRLQLLLKDIKATKRSEEITPTFWTQSAPQHEDPYFDFFQNQAEKEDSLVIIQDTPCASSILCEYWLPVMRSYNLSPQMITSVHTNDDISKLLTQTTTDRKAFFLSKACWSALEDTFYQTSSRPLSVLDTAQNRSPQTDVTYQVVQMQDLYAQLQEKRCVIWCKDTATVEQLAQQIPAADRVSLWHTGLTEDKKQEMLIRFNEGYANLMIAQYALPGHLLSEVALVVFDELPMDQTHWYHLMDKNAAWKTVYALAELPDMQQKAESYFPTRVSLKKVYGFARQANQRLSEITPSAFKKLMVQMGMTGSARAHQSIMNIFQDLGLCGLPDDPEADLHASWRYLENAQQQDAIIGFYATWQKFMEKGELL